MPLIGIELHALEPITCSLGTYMHLSIEQSGRTIANSDGVDEYRLDHRFCRGERFAATGRCSIWQFSVHPLTNQDTLPLPATPVKIGACNNAELVLQTNLQQFLSDTIPKMLLFVQVNSCLACATIDNSNCRQRQTTRSHLQWVIELDSFLKSNDY